MIPFHAIFPLTAAPHSSYMCIHTHTHAHSSLSLSTRFMLHPVYNLNSWHIQRVGVSAHGKIHWKKNVGGEAVRQQDRTKSLEKTVWKKSSNLIRKLLLHTHQCTKKKRKRRSPNKQRTITVCAFEAGDDSWHAVLTRAHSYTHTHTHMNAMFCLFAEEEKTTKHELVFLFVKTTTSLSAIAVRWNNKTEFTTTNGRFLFSLSHWMRVVYHFPYVLSIWWISWWFKWKATKKHFVGIFESIDTNMSSIRGGLNVAEQKPEKIVYFWRLCS